MKKRIGTYINSKIKAEKRVTKIIKKLNKKYPEYRHRIFHNDNGNVLLIETLKNNLTMGYMTIEIISIKAHNRKK